MNCNLEILNTLVHQSADPGEEVDSIAEHLEQCEPCRRELARLGGKHSIWIEAQTCLSHADPDIHEQDESHPQQPPVDLSFLEPATHPEMLGRIGRYEVESLLGHGGMGVVFRAHDSDLQRAVAIKVLAPHWAMSAMARQRFAREAEAAASVAHENVVPIYNVDADAKLPYLVMRYIPGMTLQRWVRTHGPLSVGTILRVAGQLAEGLSAAHRRGLVHRDIKPGNVLVGENIERVWITDFGLARAADSITLTQTGVIAGTPHYMSPEQARGQPIDHRSDLFSLGCVLYFLCTGEPPFDADNTLAVLHKIVTEHPPSLTRSRGDLPPRFVRLVNALLQRSIDHRPQDCSAVINEIAKAQTEKQRVPGSSWFRSRWRDFSSQPRVLRLTVGGGLLPVWTWGIRQLIFPDQTPTYVPVPWVHGVGSQAPAPTLIVIDDMYERGRKFAPAAERIASSLDDPRLDHRYRDLERSIETAIRSAASGKADVLLGDAFPTEDVWNRNVTAIDDQIERAMQSDTSPLSPSSSHSR